MYTIDLQAIPNQELTSTIDNVLYDLHIFDYGGGMACDISRAGETVQQGLRIVAGYPLIPFRSLEADSGNFIFITNNNELPYYSEFGLSQTLIFASADELEEIRADA